MTHNTYLDPELDFLADPFFIGFEHLNKVMRSFHNTYHNQANYPVYNVIRKDEDNYIVEIAVTGFSKDQVKVSVKDQNLIIEASSEKEESNQFIHKGIANRSFTRTFGLSEYMEVTDAKMENGLLSIFVERIVPEEKKPKSITIK